VGDAISIKRPDFRPVSAPGGNHLLIVGQNDAAALGVMISTSLSLAAQYPVATSGTVRVGARFYVLDGTPEDHPGSGVLGKVAALLPHGSTSATGAKCLASSPRWLPSSRAGKSPRPTVRSSSCSSTICRGSGTCAGAKTTSVSRKRDEDASPPDHLDVILREGPLLGVHVIVWCDTVNNSTDISPINPARVRDARAIPDEPDRLGSPSRLSSRQQARRKSGPLLQ